ncbi:MAG: carbamate kinase [Deltaproteobacteria bacterium]|nr:carbamate kinase [Deltaproteobacteria bacterium]
METEKRIKERLGVETAVVAMGGHAFIRKDEKGSIEDHEKNAAEICGRIMSLIERNYNVVVTHGNGPQVGNLLLKNEMTKEELVSMPLDVLVAETEGSLGYILQQAMLNQLRRRNINRYVVTVISQVLIDKGDPAFRNPSKPIGPFLTKEEAEKRRDTLGWQIIDDSGRGWRRVVPSPRPVKIIQRHTIRDSARAGHIVIACGGGGIPVINNANNDYQGVEAVIDKDLTASILAADIDAELLIILTDVENVFLNYGKPDQQPLYAVTVDMLEKFIEEGHFAPGSMGPKVGAVLEFLKKGGRRALITCPERLEEALAGRAGSHFVGRV